MYSILHRSGTWPETLPDSLGWRRYFGLFVSAVQWNVDFVSAVLFYLYDHEELSSVLDRYSGDRYFCYPV
jgi:hypothetical protein